MKLSIKLILVVFLLTSCNSNKKSDQELAYSQKTDDLQTSIKRGKSVYQDMCITCHLDSGKGVPKAFPPLAGSDFLKENQNKSITAVKKGMNGKIVVNGTTYNSVMSPLGLSDKEVADVMNYINNSWGNDYGKFISPEEVTKVVKNSLN
ncbi:MAG: cytochrome C [Flavobacteriaceae bacterium]|nr:cytochrome C [Flavobacteriaceae bacterium]|tara:strand:- start:24 stop:470 length:447 start_codon:yes stop_codon:yes gene_type:complete